jgi:hypothetical protein
MHARPLAAAAAVSTILLASLVPAATAGWAGPTVISGWKNGPVTIPTDDAVQVAALSLPAGRWIVWAKLFVENDGTGQASVSCLLEGGIEDSRNGEATVTLDSPAGPYGGIEPLALTASALATNGPSFVDLQCWVNSASGTPVLSARWVKFMAMRAGSLTHVDLSHGSTVTYGSGKPKVILGWRGGGSIPKGEWASVGKLWLGRGSWWVRATFTIHEDGQLGYADCRLKVGKQTRDETVFDTQHLSVGAVLDTAVHLSGGRYVKVVCKGGTLGASYGAQAVDDLSISAVKLGTLATVGDDGQHQYGSGKPKVSFSSSTNSVDLPNQQWSAVGTLGVQAGSWMFLSKATAYGDQLVECRLVASADWDQTNADGWGLALPFGVVHSFASAGSAGLSCRPSSNGQSAVGQVRMAAFKLGSLTNTQMN